ncbi:MAG TPA: riboflavin synthase [bacterium]
MFTGIIEDKGIIRALSKTGGNTVNIDIQSSLKVSPGDSIAVQGVCLTIVSVRKKGFIVQAMVQTQDITTLSRWKTSDVVNLERALTMEGRIGGHIMLGHIDETGRLIRISGNVYHFQVNPRNAGYVISKGSISIDGVSLTIGSKSQNIFTVSLIPYTLKVTTLGNLRLRSPVNIEYDYLVKILKSTT